MKEKIYFPKLTIMEHAEETMAKVWEEYTYMYAYPIDEEDEGMESPITDTELRTIFPGEDVIIHLKQRYEGKITCNNDAIYYFPFDEYYCISYILPYNSPGAWTWDGFPGRDTVSLSFDAEAELSPFSDAEIYKFKQIEGYIFDEESTLVIEVIVGRNFFTIFTTYALPTGLLTTIVLSTSLYYIEDFGSAVAVNVTCLLAMAAFQIAMYETLPRTSSMKERILKFRLLNKIEF